MRRVAPRRKGMRKMVKILATLALASSSQAVALPNGLSGLTVGMASGGLADGYVHSEVDFLLSRYFCVGPEVALAFGGGRALYAGAAGRIYFTPGLSEVLQPHLAFGAGIARDFDKEAAARGEENGAYANVALGCDVDVAWAPVSWYADAGGLFFTGEGRENGFKAEVGLRFSIGPVGRLEEEERARIAEEQRLEEERLARIAEEERVVARLADAEQAGERGDYAEGIEICEEILEAYPDRAEAAELLEELERLQAEAYKAPTPRPPRPEPTPEAEPEPEIPVISPEAVRAYEQGKGALAGGAISQAIYILSAVVREFPSYGAARAELVQAYLLQGLDSYSNGELRAALTSWRRALAFDPGNAKIQRYVKRAESELE
jgi:tetratricopeptide (TPR) repeat protein